MKFRTVVERFNIKTRLFNITLSEKIDQVVGMQYWYILYYVDIRARSVQCAWSIGGLGLGRWEEMTFNTNQFRRVQISAFLFSEAFRTE